jgi:3-methyladenine DNA glycosylase/8-oxoguanine DNA glycosylase
MSDAPDLTVRLDAPRRYDLVRTVGALRMGRSDPTFRAADRVVALARRTPAGPVTVEIEHDVDALWVRTWGEGSEWIEQHLSALAGLQDRPEDFRPEHSAVRRMLRRAPGIHLPRSPVVCARVIQVVALQLVQTREAHRAWRRLVHEIGEPAPGPQGLRLAPAPKTLGKASISSLVAHAIPHKQARTMVRVARRGAELDEAAVEGREAVTALLASMRGIGPWTINLLRGSALGDSDAVPVGDYNLPQSVGWALARERRADEDRMLELLEPFRPHRFRVLRLIVLTGGRAPRTRPRRAMRPVDPLRRWRD